MTYTEAPAAALDARLALLMLDLPAMARATRDSFGGSRVGTLADFLHSYAGGLCVSCGLPTVRGGARRGNSAEVGHLLAAETFGPSKARAGFRPGNLGNMCRTCNTDAALIGMSFSANDLRHPELVPLEWPAITKKKATVDSFADEAKAARKW